MEFIVLPLPTTYLQRTRFGEIMYKIAFPNRSFKNIDDYYRVNLDGPFVAEPLKSLNDSFYRSLSVIIFGTEKHTHVLHKAAVLHAEKHVAELSEMFRNERFEHEPAKDVSEYMHSKFGQYIALQASFIDVFVVAHMFQIPIVLFDQSDVTTPKVFLPDGTKSDDCSFYKYQNAIHLAMDTTCGTGSILFEPVKSFQRVITFSDSEEEATDYLETDQMIPDEQVKHELCQSEDMRYSVVLRDRRGLKFISIPFVKVRELSPTLAEFCGVILETNLSFDCLQRLKRHFLSPQSNVQMKLDPDLFEFARRWSINAVAEQIESLVQKCSLTKQIDFVSKIYLRNNSSLHHLLRRSLYWASLDDLKIVRIPSTSNAHKLLNEYVNALIIGREDMHPIFPRYKSPHVIVCLDENTESFGKYYNGKYWCTLFVPQSLKEIIPYLKDNKYCVKGDRVFFVKDSNTLGEVRILNSCEGRIRYTNIPPGVDDPRISTDATQDTILLLSNETERKIAEVRKSPEGDTTITSWRTVSVENYSFTFLGKVGIIYTIEHHQLALKTARSQDLKGVIAAVEPSDHKDTRVYFYEISSGTWSDEQRKEELHQVIKIPTRGDGVYLALPRRVVIEHLSKLNI